MPDPMHFLLYHAEFYFMVYQVLSKILFYLRLQKPYEVIPYFMVEKTKHSSIWSQIIQLEIVFEHLFLYPKPFTHVYPYIPHIHREGEKNLSFYPFRSWSVAPVTEETNK